jgi:hypothetical protein
VHRKRIGRSKVIGIRENPVKLAAVMLRVDFLNKAVQIMRIPSARLLQKLEIRFRLTLEGE